jgi:L-lysine exporter family protein LysE/ArgO
VGLVLTAVPWLIDVVRWAGAAFLIAYGLLAARRAWRPSGRALAPTVTGEDAADRSARTQGSAIAASQTPHASAVVARTAPRALPVALTCLALTWLNPHVYLDTVFLLGSIASTHGDARWLFAAGAMTASVVWFFALAFGARYLSRWLGTPRAWRILDAVIAVVMVGIGVSLILPR